MIVYNYQYAFIAQRKSNRFLPCVSGVRIPLGAPYFKEVVSIDNSLNRNQLLSIVRRMDEIANDSESKNYIPFKLIDGTSGTFIKSNGKVYFTPKQTYDYD